MKFQNPADHTRCRQAGLKGRFRRCSQESKVVPSSDVTECWTLGSCQIHSMAWPTLTVMLFGTKRPSVFGSGMTLDVSVGVAVLAPLTVQPGWSAVPLPPEATAPPHAASVIPMPTVMTAVFHQSMTTPPGVAGRGDQKRY